MMQYLSAYFNCADSTSVVTSAPLSCKQTALFQAASGNLIKYCSIVDTTNTMTFVKADAACKSLNYTLAIIDTADKHRFIWSNDYSLFE